MRTILFGLMTLVFGPCFSYELMVRSPEGELFCFEVGSEESLEVVVNSVAQAFPHHKPFVVDFRGQMASQEAWETWDGVTRDFSQHVTQKEKKDIGTIVNILGMGSLLKIATSHGVLKKAGERVRHVHPLRFLQVVFTDEEMKVSLHALHQRGWIWDEFYNGLKNSLEEETNRNNMLPQFISHFAEKVGVELKLINSQLQNRQWDQFIKTLITHIPLKGDQDRYNM